MLFTNLVHYPGLPGTGVICLAGHVDSESTSYFDLLGIVHWLATAHYMAYPKNRWLPFSHNAEGGIFSRI